MRNIVAGKLVQSCSIIRDYADLQAGMNTVVSISVADNFLIVQLFEDYRMLNNPFSEITNFPTELSFSCQKVSTNEDLLQNLWTIKIPITLIDFISEEFDEDESEHSYIILTKKWDIIFIEGKHCSFLDSGLMSEFNTDEGDDDPYLNRGDIYNKVEIQCHITENDKQLAYLKMTIESLTNRLKKGNSIKVNNKDLEVIEEMAKRIVELEKKIIPKDSEQIVNYGEIVEKIKNIKKILDKDALTIILYDKDGSISRQLNRAYNYDDIHYFKFLDMDFISLDSRHIDFLKHFGKDGY